MPFKFDEADLAVIATAVAAGGDIWENDLVKKIKAKIKNYYLNLPVSKCCYCARLMNGEFKMVIDIEHVLPKSIYETEMFVMNNLNISCKRCNMEIKGVDISFLVDPALMGTDYYHSKNYHFIHPNLDTYSDHL